ncbi:MAG: antitoxin family protein [Pseudomonadota bacterium]
MVSIEAEYVGGMLRPEKPLRLRPGERVRVIVVRKAEPERWDLRRLASKSGEDSDLAGAGLEEWADALDEEDAR